VVDDDKIRSDYSSSKNVNVKSLVSCVLFYFWVLFVCLFVCKLMRLLFVLQWSSGSASVLMMEQVPCCIGDGLYGDVNHISRC